MYLTVCPDLPFSVIARRCDAISILNSSIVIKPPRIVEQSVEFGRPRIVCGPTSRRTSETALYYACIPNALGAFAARQIPHYRAAISGSGRPETTGKTLSSRISMATDTLEHAESLLAALSLDDGFHPQELRSEKDSGLSATLIEDLVLKYLSGVGSASGRAIADHLCLPLVVLENRYAAMRTRQEISPVSSGMLGDHVYRLTDQGRDRAQRAIRECAYAGPAPVPLEDYVNSVHAQNIRSEKPRRKQLEAAFADILVSPDLFGQLGPAINAGKGMFIYGPPGNGKTTIAQRITRCFGQTIFRPARDRRGWSDHQAVRRRLSPAGPFAGGELCCGRPNSTAAGSEFSGRRSWSAAN